MAAKFPVNPYFREFVYDILYNLPTEMKFDLKGKYYKIGKSVTAAKKFCDTAGYDEMLYVLHQIGVEWYTVIFDSRIEKHKSVRGVFEKFDADNPLPELSKVIKKRIYISSSKQFIDNLATAARTIHTNTYIRNLELVKAGFHLRQWPKKLKTPNLKEALLNDDTLRYLAETVVHSILATDKVKLSRNDIIVLLFFYANKHLYVDYNKLGEKFAGYLSRYKIIASVRRLQEEQMIRRHLTEKRFSITSFGVDQVSSVISNVLRENTF